MTLNDFKQLDPLSENLSELIKLYFLYIFAVHEKLFPLLSLDSK